METIASCQSCDKLFISTIPKTCPCGSKDIKTGVSFLSYENKQRIAEIRRKQANEGVKRTLGLKGNK